MSKKSIFCIAASRNQADRIVDCLKTESFSNNDISVLFADQDDTHDFAHEKHTKEPEAVVTGAGVGGETLRWIPGMGTLATSGVGSFIAAGPIITVFRGASVGATVCDIAGGLIEMGIPEFEARRYEGKIKQGNVLISVHTENSDKIARAKELFTQAGAHDIYTTLPHWLRPIKCQEGRS